MPYPGSPRRSGKDLPFDHGKGIQEKVLPYFHNKKKKAIQEEDVCGAKLLYKPSVDSHPPLAILWRQFPPAVLFYETFLVNE